MWRRLIHNLTAGLFPAVIRKETKDKTEMAKYLIVGLGNIGDEYQHTRHNIGFDIIDTFAESVGATWQDRRYGMVATCRVKSAQLVLLKPSTYMNLSGNAVRYWLQQEKVPVENLLVLVDDLNIPFGKLRIRRWSQRTGTYPAGAGYGCVCTGAIRYRQRVHQRSADQLRAGRMDRRREAGPARATEDSGRDYSLVLLTGYR